MKYVIIIVFSIVTQFVIAQEFTLYKTTDFTGVIFPAEYFDDENETHFTPTENDILRLETNLQNASNAELGTKKKEVKLEYLKNCHRQYAGIIAGNNKLIYITYIHKKDIDENPLYKDWKSEVIYGEHKMFFSINDGKFHQLEYE